jgi:alpha-tubulin suppressor-like RCC1 family protein
MSGVVTGLDDGEATITATSEGQSGTAKVTVRAPVARVSVSAAVDTLEAYEAMQLQALLRDAKQRTLTGRPVRWTSSNPAVASVDSVTGVLTGVDRGTVTVTATSEGKTGTASRVVVIRYRSITTASEHACNIASGGIVWCWGVNGLEGRIGSDDLGHQVHSTTPVRLPTALRFVQVTSYGRATCGIATDGRAYCWGYSGWGMLGNGSTANSTTPVAVTGGHTFKQLAAGADHVCGVTTDGRALCWGGNWGGQLGNGGGTASTTPVAAMPEMRFASITAGAEYTCGITTAGISWCWGYNGVGNLCDGLKPSMSNTYTRTGNQVVGGHAFRQIMAGASHTCGVTADGRAYCWGRNGGTLGNGNANETSTPSAVVGGLTFRSIATGHSATCGVTAGGDLYCWGSNGNGQLGTNIPNGSNSPVRGAGTLKLADVAVANIATGSGAYACGTSEDRLTTYCWGRNNLGQLGNGATTAVSVSNPTPSIVIGQRPL